MSPRPAFAAACTLILLLSGCVVISVPPPVQSPQQDTPSPATEPLVAEEAPPAFGDGYTPVDPATLVAPDQAGISFVSPSRNLKCGIVDGYNQYDGVLEDWGCTIGEKNWSFPADSPGDYCYQPETSCGWGIVAWGSELPLPRYNGGIQFSSEQDQGNYPVLAYGQSVTYLGVTCISSEDGIQCQHSSSGHGFLISRSDNLIY